jgi:hypothetical protein
LPTIKITGLSDEILRRLDGRACARGEGRSGHIRRLIEQDLAQEESRQTGKSFDEALAAIRQGFAESGISEEATLSLLSDSLKATRADRRAMPAKDA